MPFISAGYERAGSRSAVCTLFLRVPAPNGTAGMIFGDLFIIRIEVFSGKERMAVVAHIISNEVSTVRIHDDFIGEGEQYAGQLSRIISESYRRRRAEQMGRNAAPGGAAEE